ncbi:GntR family transcriptional regulator [Cellulosimicrobium funkei]|nr:GntR family transcriptional regulator [Cellulosimicrobium funkei]
MESVQRASSLTDQAIESIRASIVSGDLVPGELYMATKLGRQLNVSRTPIREALQELARRGLVRIERNRGVRMLSTSLQSFVEVFQIRLMLEAPLASRATQLKDPAFSAAVEESYEAFRRVAESGEPGRVLRADRDFHRTLLSGAGNANANQLLSEQRDVVLNTGVGTVPTSRTAQECFEDHLDIMVAFREGRPQDVSTAVARHISHTATMLIAQATRDRPEFGDAGSAEAIEWLVHD